MSIWTHVAATFRVDGLRPLGDKEPDWDEVIGKETYEPLEYAMDSEEWRKYRDSIMDADEHPDSYMPRGSEGSLRKTIWRNPKENHAAAYVVTVFGDLRDYDDERAIKKWFTNVCQRCWIRQAVCDVVVDGYHLRHETWNHEDVCGDEDEVA